MWKKYIIFGNLEGKLLLGRPSSRWEDTWRIEVLMYSLRICSGVGVLPV
jgi:hypothetical protein